MSILSHFFPFILLSKWIKDAYEYYEQLMRFENCGIIPLSGFSYSNTPEIESEVSVFSTQICLIFYTDMYSNTSFKYPSDMYITLYLKFLSCISLITNFPGIARHNLLNFSLVYP